MIVNVLEPVEIEVYAVRINAELHDDTYQDIPVFMLEDGGDFEITIEVDTGRVLNWRGDKEVTVLDKVSDGGTYTLLNKDGNEVARIEYGYVPNDLIPGHYGDYIDMRISAEGVVTNWPEKPSVNQFFENTAY